MTRCVVQLKFHSQAHLFSYTKKKKVRNNIGGREHHLYVWIRLLREMMIQRKTRFYLYKFREKRFYVINHFRMSIKTVQLENMHIHVREYASIIRSHTFHHRKLRLVFAHKNVTHLDPSDISCYNGSFNEVMVKQQLRRSSFHFCVTHDDCGFILLFYCCFRR